MLKKTITYEDFDGLERTEDFYFNLTKTELTEMNLSKQGGYAQYLKDIVNAKDGPTLAKLFKELLLMAVGQKSEDGRYFLKNDTIRQNFECSAAYDVIYSEIISNEDAAVEFFTKMLPASLQDEVAKQLKENKDEIIKK